jgi:hypothetical protein
MLPDVVSRAVTSYLSAADRLLPGRVYGCYVYGSVAFGAYWERRSDIDLLVVLDDAAVTRAELRRLRLLHLAQVPRLAGRILTGRGLSATCNVAFVRQRDLVAPVTMIQPVASHTGHKFRVGAAFDVNPVMWHVLATCGISVRGPDPSTLALDPEPAVLRRWNLDNLHHYWGGLASSIEARSRPLSPARVAWSVLGPLRLHATIATGDVLSKADAGHYGLGAFGGGHAALIRYASAVLRDEPRPLRPPHHTALTADFIRDVIADADRLVVDSAQES